MVSNSSCPPASLAEYAAVIHQRAEKLRKKKNLWIRLLCELNSVEVSTNVIRKKTEGAQNHFSALVWRSKSAQNHFSCSGLILESSTNVTRKHLQNGLHINLNNENKKLHQTMTNFYGALLTSGRQQKKGFYWLAQVKNEVVLKRVLNRLFYSNGRGLS